MKLLGGGIWRPVLHGQGGAKARGLLCQGLFQRQGGLTGLPPLPGVSYLRRVRGGRENAESIFQCCGNGLVYCMTGMQKALIRALEDGLLIPADGLLPRGGAQKHQHHSQNKKHPGRPFYVHMSFLPLASAA